jgi:hypothetical protein
MWNFNFVGRQIVLPISQYACPGTYPEHIKPKENYL